MNERISEPLPQMADESIDLHGVFVRFMRRLPIFLAVGMVILLGVVGYTLRTVPTYTATTSLIITPQGTNVLKEDQSAGAPADSSTVDTQVQVLGSRALAKRVVQHLHLVNDPEFNAALRPKKKGFSLATLFKAAKPTTGAAAQAAGPDRAEEDVTDVVEARTKARRSGLTYQIDVSFTALSGEKAALIANSIASEYIDSEVETKYNSVRGSSEFISERLNSLAREVEANDAAVQQYKIAHNLMSAQGSTIAEQEMSTLNQQIAVARADLAEKQARLNAAREQIRRGGGGGDVAAALGSQVVQSLRAQRATITQRQAELESRYGPLHPEVKKVQRELADNATQIQEEIGRITSNLEAEVQVAQQRVTSLETSLGRAQGSLGASNQALVGLNELQRKVDASKAVYESFLSRSKESSAQEGLQKPDARITSPAEAPTRPTAPNKPLNFALGFVLAVAAGAGAVLVAENLDSAMLTSRDVEQKLQMPCIGAVPLLRPVRGISKEGYVLAKPFSAFAEAFRGLKTALTLSRDDRPTKIISVASALPGEGKTLTTMSFGRALAQSGAKVLIIDADLRRRQLTNAFRQTVDAGLVEVLEGSSTLEKAMELDEPSGARLLLLSEKPAPTVDLFSSGALDELFAEAREKFDFIVLDTAPVLAVAETRAIAVRSDATVFLVRWCKTPKQAAGGALDLLISSGAFVAGVCLTQVDLSKQSRLGYGDKMYYYRGYNKYYSE
jgi:capsular exopolysaccharide synthesis family protein